MKYGEFWSDEVSIVLNQTWMAILLIQLNFEADFLANFFEENAVFLGRFSKNTFEKFWTFVGLRS